MKNIKIFLTIIFLFNAVPALLFAQTGYKVIVNNSVDVEEISKKELSNIFLKKKKKWADGTTVLPVDLKSNSKIREKFTKEVHRKNLNAIKAYWQKQIFSGRNIPPVEKASDSEIISYVKTNPGAVGYISSNSSATDVKTIKIIQ